MAKKPKIEPPPPERAEDAKRTKAAQTILRAYVAAMGENIYCCDIEIMQAAMVLARHELARDK